MQLKDTLHFDATSYEREIREKGYTFGELARDIYIKRRQIVSSEVTVVTGLACVHVSGGTSLLGSAYAARNVNVEERKLALLEHLWKSTGMNPLPPRNITDTVIPVAISTAIGAFTFSIDLGISNAVATAAYASQMGIPGYALPINSHLIGGGYFGVEKGMGWVGVHANEMIARKGNHSDKKIHG